MATSGEEEINSSTVPESEVMCSPCQLDGKRLGAVGYCVNCPEYLCEECFKCHILPSVTRKHILLDKERMAKDISAYDRNRCSEHAEKAIEYHCHTHSFLGCHICFFQHQKTCKDVKYIPDLVETFTSSEEFQTFSTKLADIATKTKTLITEAKRKKESIEKCHSEATAAFKAFKSDVLEMIERLEKELTEKVDGFRESENMKINSIIRKCTDIEREHQALSTEVAALQNKNQTCDLFIAVAKSEEKLRSLEEELNTAERDKTVKHYTFEANAELLQMLKSPWGLGKFRHSNEITRLEHVKDINVKIGDDNSDCYIRGSVIMPKDKLVVTDYRNNKMKLIDTRLQKLVSDMKLTSRPWSVAKTTDTTVVVTVPNEKKLVYVRTDPALSIVGELIVNVDCHGVAYGDGKLYVTLCNAHKVQVMDLQGTVLHSIETDDKGQALFSSPYDVAINPEHRLMYVSNYGSDDLTCLGFNGNAVATYRDNELRRPCQLLVDSTGMVYVCAYSSHTLHQVSEDCKKVKVLLTSNDGLRYPEAVSYDEKEGVFYVGEWSGNNVKVYRACYAAL